MDLGATLRQARGARSLTCEQVARSTRIPLRIILAMEQDEWAQVPGGVFARGYLRAYAREVGLDGDALAARFDAEHAPPPPPEKDAGPAPAEGRWEAAPLRWRWDDLATDSSRRLSWAGVIALSLVVYFAGRWSADRWSAPDDPQAAASSVAAPTDALGERIPQTVGTTDIPSAPARTTTTGVSTARRGDVPLPALDVPLVVDIAVTRPCWVTGSADGSRFVYRILRPGERVQASGRVLTLRVGDAAALRVSLDGQPAQPLGASGEVVSVRMTRENYRSFLAAASGE